MLRQRVMKRPQKWTPMSLALSSLLGLAFGIPAFAQYPAFPPPLSESEVKEVQAAISAMKRDLRGPYLRIRWFCNDGTVQPPAGSPCAARGGGVQHAEFNDLAKRLASLHIHDGTILLDSLDSNRDHIAVPIPLKRESIRPHTAPNKNTSFFHQPCSGRLRQLTYKTQHA